MEVNVSLMTLGETVTGADTGEEVIGGMDSMAVSPFTFGAMTFICVSGLNR